ncbi:putative sensory transduction regulator [Thermosporothrix hazakensis]|uniref:YbjN domain-containing protein n=2 Tax=Thermosporothrix TaxID=768650 RepID=A0A455SNM2_9CHLR|nr:YbjN domain-containing protein [Thermosporothrix hazakensis]PZW36305.1 putative sensory transduction regulator [Thermosporothrix hazakensis]BBH88771.1 hypothetical protein KTC_35220 [Thermosporothrix sp. COM3]GCE46955.1 hypothetical protein KTH_18240 [Thermosporothrix hazakensis]
MPEHFGLSHLIQYLTQMGLKVANVNEKQELVEMAFHGEQGQWRLIIGFHQSGETRKLMFIVPHIATLGLYKRQECLEALMAVNYRIAIGKFGLDLNDGEIRLEETIPLADNGLSFEQFQLATRAIMQTIGIYQSLLPRILYGHKSVHEALEECEQEFFQRGKALNTTTFSPVPPPDNELHNDLNAEDVLAEVVRLLEENKKRD